MAGGMRVGRHRAAHIALLLGFASISGVGATLCSPGSHDHDTDESTACLPCAPGSFCGGGTQPGTSLQLAAGLPETSVSGVAAYGYPLNSYFEKTRFQSLYLRSELFAAGVQGGDKIESISVKASQRPGFALQNFRIAVGNTADITSLGVFQTSLVQFGPVNVPKSSIVVNNWNEFVFDDAWLWDGTSSVVLETSIESNFYKNGGGVYMIGESTAGMEFRSKLAMQEAFNTDGTSTSAYPFTDLAGENKPGVMAMQLKIQGPPVPKMLCAAGTYDHDSDSSTPCNPCPVGSFCQTGATAIEYCAAGSRDHDDSSVTECVACAAGTYCAGSAAPQVACMPGEHDHDLSSTTSCQPCTSGQHCPGAAGALVQCGGGKTDDDSNPATACEWCPAGTLFSDSVTCTPCEPGFHCGGGHESKVACAGGESDHDMTSATPCFVCLEGTFCAGGTASQELCAAGSADADNDPSTQCDLCPAGSFCGGGYVTNSNGVATAVALAWCPPGTHDEDELSSTPCSQCAPGFYCAGSEAAKAECQAGFIDHDADASTACQACPAGTIWANSVTCQACPSGTFCAGQAHPLVSCSTGLDLDYDSDSSTPCDRPLCQCGTKLPTAPAFYSNFRAPDFDGTGDGVTIGSSPDYNVQSLSIQTRIKISASNDCSSTSSQYIVSHGGCSGYSLFLTGTGSQGPGCYLAMGCLCDTCGDPPLVAPAPLSAQSWHNVTGTFDASTQQAVLYTDGWQVASETKSFAFQATDGAALAIATAISTDGSASTGTGSVRLAHGSASSNTGRLEVNVNGAWGTVCDDDFTDIDAKVVCRELGYDVSDASTYSHTQGFGSTNPGSGSILMDDVGCSGTENTLASCSHTSAHNCGHSEDVGVTCTGAYTAPPGSTTYGTAAVAPATLQAELHYLFLYSYALSTDEGKQLCVQCANGTVSDSVDAYSCGICQVGSHSVRGACGCKTCVAGTTDEDLDASTACSPCQTGYFCAGGTASTACPVHSDSALNSVTVSHCKCVEGYSGSPQLGAACEGCAAGTFKHILGSSDCVACSANSNSFSSSAQCVCDPGYTGADGSPPNCLACSTGKYKTVSGVDACTDCPAHSSSDPSSAEAEDCLCSKGYSGPNGGVCSACPAGQFKSSEGPDPCEICEVGTFNPNLASVSVGACKPCNGGMRDHDDDASTPCEQSAPLINLGGAGNTLMMGEGGMLSFQPKSEL